MSFYKLQLFDIDWISIIKSYLCGLLGAVTVYGIMHCFDARPYKVGTVNITRLVDQFVKQEANKNLPPEILKKEVNMFGKILEAELKIFSKKNNLVLLPSEAVIAGSQDYTSIVRQKIDNKLPFKEMLNVD